MSIELRQGQKPHWASSRLLSETLAISLLSRTQGRIFPAMESQEISLEFLRFKFNSFVLVQCHNSGISHLLAYTCPPRWSRERHYLARIHALEINYSLINNFRKKAVYLLATTVSPNVSATKLKLTKLILQYYVLKFNHHTLTFPVTEEVFCC